MEREDKVSSLRSNKITTTTTSSSKRDVDNDDNRKKRKVYDDCMDDETHNQHKDLEHDDDDDDDDGSTEMNDMGGAYIYCPSADDDDDDDDDYEDDKKMAPARAAEQRQEETTPSTTMTMTGEVVPTEAMARTLSCLLDVIDGDAMMFCVSHDPTEERKEVDTWALQDLVLMYTESLTMVDVTATPTNADDQDVLCMVLCRDEIKSILSIGDRFSSSLPPGRYVDLWNSNFTKTGSERLILTIDAARKTRNMVKSIVLTFAKLIRFLSIRDRLDRLHRREYGGTSWVESQHAYKLYTLWLAIDLRLMNSRSENDNDHYYLYDDRGIQHSIAIPSIWYHAKQELLLPNEDLQLLTRPTEKDIQDQWSILEQEWPTTSSSTGHG